MHEVIAHHGIMGMKWGVRRYQNKDGTLTSAGKARYARDKRENAAKKKDSRIDLSEPDPKRWAKEDLKRSKELVDLSTSSVRLMRDLERAGRPKIDLSSMSDEEMRKAINRTLLEQQYKKLFEETNSSNISKGRQYLTTVLETTGNILTVAGSALSIALAIKNLKG